LTIEEVFIAVAGAAIFALLVRALTSGSDGWEKVSV
jgi:hypothetical protein